VSVKCTIAQYEIIIRTETRAVGSIEGYTRAIEFVLEGCDFLLSLYAVEVRVVFLIGTRNEGRRSIEHRHVTSFKDTERLRRVLVGGWL